MSNTVMLWLLALASAVILVLQILLLRKDKGAGAADSSTRFEYIDKNISRIEGVVKDEVAKNRQELMEQLRSVRTELAATLSGFNDSIIKQLGENATQQRAQLESFAQRLTEFSQLSEQKHEALRLGVDGKLKDLATDSGVRIDKIREENIEASKQNREQVARTIDEFKVTMSRSMTDLSEAQKERLGGFEKQLRTLAESNERRLVELREAVEKKLTELQGDNATKLEEMRKTVDEKLQGTLEKRLGESFRLVSERLEQVQRGLGEMQTLANGVGDLKKVLTNVRARGVWGEMQLGNLLEQIMTPEQYAQNIATRPNSNDRVEFAIKMPGREGDVSKFIWMPIDAKFPREDYERLANAAEIGDQAAVEAAAQQLELRVKSEAKSIRDKYVEPPYTTDFGILYLPTEGLYAEVLRRPGLVDMLQREYRVNVAGPTTLAALLNSLQMGFRTLAIEKRSSEVWMVLGAIKTEFGKFGDVVGKVQKKLQEASNVIDTAAVRTRVIERKLKNVQELPKSEAVRLLASDGEDESQEDNIDTADIDT